MAPNILSLNLLSRPETAARIREFCDEFDHVIIDTPPVLAFTDALLWARVSDATVLTSFIDHTSKLDLKESIRRLEDMHARILGTVVNNVKASQSYHRYGYGYGYADRGGTKNQSEKPVRHPKLLLTSQP